MSESHRAPEPDTSRVQARDGRSVPPAPRVNEILERTASVNPTLQRAAEAQVRQPVPIPEPEHPDPEVELAKPLDALPKWEAEHTFTLSHPVQRTGGGVLNEVRLRSPQGLDMFEIGGMPTKTQWTQTGMSIEMDADRFKKWLQRLVIDCDMPTLYRIPARDMRVMFEWLNGELNQAGN